MLDVSAAFVSATGVLNVDVTNTSDIATLRNSGSDLSIKDASNTSVDIQVDGASGMVALADIKEVVIRGDANPHQEVVFETALSLDDSLVVDGEIETTRLASNITSVSSISFGSDVVLNNNVTLVGSDVMFAGTVDSQANATRSLTVDAGAGIVKFNGDIGAGVSLRGLDIQRADGGVVFGDTSTVSTINSTDAVSIGSNSAIGGSGVVFNAGDGNTLSVTTTNDDVAINGTTELQSNLSIDTGTRGGDITFTDAAAIDSEAGENNDLTLNAGEGSVSVSQNIGSNEALGKFVVTQADGGVTIGDTSAVSLIRADNGIDIGTGTNQIDNVGLNTGITLNGGASTLVLETNGFDIRLNGATTLASDVLFDTGTGDGNVTLTNDTPVDSELNEFNDLTFDVGAGMIFINEDLGRTNPLGSLTVITAGGGVVFGEAATEVPGSGSTGPVAEINAANGINIGVGANTIGGKGVVFRGSTADAKVTTTNNNIRINGATTLGTDVTFSTGGGDLTFTSATPVDGVTGTTSSLSIDLGDGSLFVNADIGQNEAIGELNVVTANGGVTFGGSAPVTLVNAKQPINIGVGTNTISGTGITLNGGSNELLFQTDDANVRLNGAITAQSDVAVDTGDGGGSILLTSDATLNSATGTTSNIRLDAGAGGISVNANVGEQEVVGTFTIERASAGVSLGGADTASPSGVGPVTQITSDGEINIGSIEAISNGIKLNGGGNALTLSTTADNITLDGAIALQSDVGIDTGAAGGDLTLSAISTVNSQPGEANDLSLTLGGGNALFNAAIGNTSPLGELRIVSAVDVMAQAAVNASRVVQQAGTGTTTFESTIKTTDATAIGIELTGNSFVFNDTIAAMGDGRVTIVHSGLLDVNSAATMQLEGSFNESGSGSTEIATNITTSGDEIHFSTPITLTDGSQVSFDTTGSANSAGASITFDQTVNAATASVETLTLNAGTTGNIAFDGAVGDADRLGQIDITEANNLTLASSLATTNFLQTIGHGTTTFSGTVNTSAAGEKGIDVTATDIAFEDAVTTTGDGRVELTASGTIDLATAADMNLSGTFLQDGGAAVVTSADITTNNADITFTDAVTLRQGVRFDTGAGSGDLTFSASLDGTTDCQEDLMVALGTGNALFQAPVGGNVGLGDLQIDNATNVRFESSLRVASLVQTTGSGETRFDAAVTAKTATGIDLTTTSVTINDSFDTSAASGPISITTTGDIAVNAAVTSGTALVDLSSGDDVLFGANGSITTTGPTVNVSATNDIRLGRIVATTLVRLTSTDGAIIDGGDAGGADIVADQLALRSHSGMGTDNPLDISVNTVAATNQQAGGIRVENKNGNGTLTVGDIDGLSGISNGPTAAPAKFDGEVEVIHVGAIDITSPILNDGGSDTIVRAELPGDLTVDAPIQNRGGNGWIVLFSGGDLTINHSVPEPQAEISVENEGAVRGVAQGDVVIDNSATDYVIVRTHAERFPNADPLPTLSARFQDPARYPDPSDTTFYTELEAELRTIRNSISGQATNFAPIFDIEPVDQGGSDVDSNGRGLVKVTIGDGNHLETNWHFTIDWGDGTIENYSISGNPQASLTFLTAKGANTNRFPDLTNTARIDSGVSGEPGVYFVHHQYLSPPDPTDPAAPTPISAELRYDAREEGEAKSFNLPGDDGTAIFNGIQFFQNGSELLMSTDEDVLTNPGEGTFFAIKIIESVIIPVESRQATSVFFASTSSSTTVSTRSTFEFAAASFEAETSEEYRLFMRVVDDVASRAQQDASNARSAPASGEEGTYDLPLELLSDPLQIFRDRQFPNGHYQIFLEEIRTGRVRLILDVHIYQGRVVPENFREGAAERQPGSDDSSAIHLNADPIVMEQEQHTDDADVPAEQQRVVAAPAGTPQSGDSNSEGNTSRPRRSAMMLPVAASTLPWATRVRRALQAETGPISRTSLRLRKRPRV